VPRVVLEGREDHGELSLPQKGGALPQHLVVAVGRRPEVDVCEEEVRGLHARDRSVSQKVDGVAGRSLAMHLGDARAWLPRNAREPPPLRLHVPLLGLDAEDRNRDGPTPPLGQVDHHPRAVV